MVILLVTFFSVVLNYVQNVLSFVMWLETCIHIYIYMNLIFVFVAILMLVEGEEYAYIMQTVTNNRSKFWL